MNVGITKLLDGSSGSLADARTSTLFSNSSIDVTTQESAVVSLSTIEDAMKKMDDIRSSLAESTASMEIVPTEQKASETKIRDFDFATENDNLLKKDQTLHGKSELTMIAKKTGMGNSLNLFG